MHGWARTSLPESLLFLPQAFDAHRSIIIENNNKRRKTSNLFRKIRNIKGAFCPKMGTIKDKNGRDLVDAEEIKKKWKDYIEEL